MCSARLRSSKPTCRGELIPLSKRRCGIDTIAIGLLSCTSGSLQEIHSRETIADSLVASTEMVHSTLSKVMVWSRTGACQYHPFFMIPLM